MCGGQALDLSGTDKAISLAELEHLHSLKTGALLEAAVKMAAECSNNATAHDKEQLAIYAKLVGLAYQVRDDIIDITSTEEVNELVKKIAEQLEQQIQDGAIELESLGQQVIIRIRENGSFPSGSAFLQPQFKPIMRKTDLSYNLIKQQKLNHQIR